MLPPETRWAVLRAAVATKSVPQGCLGLLAYLIAVAPETIRTDDLTEAADCRKDTLRKRLKLLEAAGFITTRLTQHGKILVLLVPPSLTVHMVKLGQKDTGFQKGPPSVQVAIPEPPGASRLLNGSYLESEVPKRELPGKVEVPNPELPEIEVPKRELPEAGSFLRGMLEALEDGSKPGETDPSCPDNSVT